VYTNTKMVSMEDMRKVMREEMSAMREVMSTSMKDEMNAMKTAMNELEQRLAKKFKTLLETENEKLKTLVVEQGKRIKKLEADNDMLNKRMNAYEQYSRRSNVQINNIPSVQGESIEAIVCEMGQKVGVPIVFNTDVQAAHRVPTKGTVEPIIVKFTNRQVRNKFIIEARKAKLQCNQLESTKNLLFSAGSQSKIFVSDHLTPANAKIFYEARKIVKEKKAKSTWTRDGKIFIKKTDQSEAVEIGLMSDLKTFLVSYSQVLTLPSE
jgi:hypothetical protein